MDRRTILKTVAVGMGGLTGCQTADVDTPSSAGETGTESSLTSKTAQPTSTPTIEGDISPTLSPAAPTETPSPEAPTATAKQTTTDTSDKTMTTSTESAGQADIEIVQFSVPDTAEIGQDFDITIAAENFGGADGSLNVGLSVRTFMSVFDRAGVVSFDVPAGERSHKKLTWNWDWMNELTFRLETVDCQLIADAKVETIQAEQGIYDSFKTAYDIDISPSSFGKTSDSVGGETAPEGETYAIVTLEVTNDSDEFQTLPDPMDFLLETAGGSVYERVELSGYSEYDGGRVTPGATKSGDIVFSISEEEDPNRFIYDEMFEPGPITVFWG